ncbi:MAG: hypothetical protein ACYDHY_17275 [Acidiferrobacterales bacterium]
MSNVKTMPKKRIRVSGEAFARGAVLRLALDKRADLLAEMSENEQEIDRLRHSMKRHGDAPLKKSPDDHIAICRAATLTDIISEGKSDVG